jgi:predicted CoA-binding protein
VALVGASGDAAKNTARPQRFLRKHGYAGRVVPINPMRDEVLGERAYPSLAEAPERSITRSSWRRARRPSGRWRIAAGAASPC